MTTSRAGRLLPARIPTDRFTGQQGGVEAIGETAIGGKKDAFEFSHDCFASEDIPLAGVVFPGSPPRPSVAAAAGVGDRFAVGRDDSKLTAFGGVVVSDEDRFDFFGSEALSEQIKSAPAKTGITVRLRRDSANSGPGPRDNIADSEKSRGYRYAQFAGGRIVANDGKSSNRLRLMGRCQAGQAQDDCGKPEYENRGVSDRGGLVIRHVFLLGKSTGNYGHRGLSFIMLFADNHIETRFEVGVKTGSFRADTTEYE